MNEKIILNFLILLLALFLVSIYWIAEDWFRYIGLIGYALIGWYWRKE